MNYKKILKPVLIIVVAIALFAAGWFGNNLYQKQQASAAKSTATAFVTDIANGDANSAYDMMSDAVKQDNAQEEFVNAWKVFAANSIDVSEPIIVSNNGTVYYSQTIYGLKDAVGGQNNVTLLLALQKSGQKWVVASASVQ